MYSYFKNVTNQQQEKKWYFQLYNQPAEMTVFYV